MDVKKVWENVKDLGTLRLSMIGGGAVLVVSLLFLGWMQVQRADMTLLYSNLDVRDGTQIAEKLQSMGVPFDVRDGGTQVYVPTDDVLRLRMSLAEAGMPAGGGV